MIMMRMKTELKNDLLYSHETKHFGLSVLFNYSCIFSPSLAKITQILLHSSSSSSSSSSGAEPPLIEGFGLLNDILPLCSILDTG